MDKEVAKALMALAVAIDEPLGRMEAVIERIEDVEIRKRFRRAAGDVMGAIFEHIIYPLETMYPELNPDAD
jgi:hypothetical protein